MAREKISRKNHEGYADETPFYALRGFEIAQDRKDANRMKQAIREAKEIFLAAGFEVEGRITLRNVRTGEIYK